MNIFLRWWLYPLIWIGVIASVTYVWFHPDDLMPVQAVKGGLMVGVLLLAEWRYPIDPRWGMTRRYFFQRDLVFIVINGAVIWLLTTGVGIVAVQFSFQTTGLMSGQSIGLQVIVVLLVFEALQYSIHRVMHVAGGPITNLLWRAHAIHHLPQQLYVMMHAVFHPINAIPVRLFVQLFPVWWLGYDAYPLFVASSIIAMHGLISHFNVDLRMGWLNYVFVGTELHRYHHSASAHEAVNYGATLSIFDLVFGTFMYRPGIPPRQLGLREEDGYPGQVDSLSALGFGFSSRPVAAATGSNVEQPPALESR